MVRRERRVAPAVVVVIAAVSVGLLSATAWIGWKVYSDSHSLCGRWPVSSSAIPSPDGFEIERSVSVSPEGCGADFKRLATLVPTSDAKQEPLERYMRSLIADGWIEVDCALPEKSCLDNGRHFVAITEDHSALIVSVQPSSHA